MPTKQKTTRSSKRSQLVTRQKLVATTGDENSPWTMDGFGDAFRGKNHYKSGDIDPDSLVGMISRFTSPRSLPHPLHADHTHQSNATSPKSRTSVSTLRTTKLTPCEEPCSYLEAVSGKKIVTEISPSLKTQLAKPYNQTPEHRKGNGVKGGGFGCKRQLKLDSSDVLEMVVSSDDDEEATPVLEEEDILIRGIVQQQSKTPIESIFRRNRKHDTKQETSHSTKPISSRTRGTQLKALPNQPLSHTTPTIISDLLSDDNNFSPETPKPSSKRTPARRTTRLSVPWKSGRKQRQKLIDVVEMKVDSDDRLCTPRPARKRPSPNSTPLSTKKHRRNGTTPKTCIAVRVAPCSIKSHTVATPKHCTPKTRKKGTPYIPERKKMVSKTKDQFELAKERLHVSAVPDSLPCREAEFAAILSFVEGKLQDGTGGCMYISGVPGTGKTATINELASYIKSSASRGELPDFDFVEVNGLRLTEPHQAYVSILKQLTGEKATTDHAANLLDKRFSQKNTTTTLLLADELDLLWTRKQTVLYNLFDWPSREGARLIVLAVANTMDLPERIMKNKVASRLGLTRLTFQPYTFRQLQEIVSSRMSGLKIFEPDAIQLAARKVAAVSGDARRALDICRRATELAHSSGRGHGLIDMTLVDQVVKEMYSAAKIQAIKSGSLHEKMVLKALVAECQRSGIEEATLKQVSLQLQALYHIEGMPPIGHSQLVRVCSSLCASRLLLVESRKSQRRVRLNISTDDILFALRDV